jgi:site-specific recombinase XerD
MNHLVQSRSIGGSSINRTDRDTAMYSFINGWLKSNGNQGTSSNYASKQKIYREWMVKYGLNVISPSIEGICHFLIWLKLGKGSSLSTIEGYISAIADIYRHDEIGRNISHHPLVRDIVKVVKNNSVSPSAKLPLDEGIYERIVAFVNWSSYESVRNYSMLLLAYALMRRESEIVTIQASDIQFIQRGVHDFVLSVDVSVVKQRIQRKENKLISPSTLPHMDVIRVIAHFCSLRLSGAKTFFHVVGEDKQLSPSTPNHILKNMLKQAGYSEAQISSFGSQSCRRGGASAAAAMGVPVYLIQQYGTWKSDCVKRYLIPTPQSILSVTSHMNFKKQRTLCEGMTCK